MPQAPVIRAHIAIFFIAIGFWLGALAPTPAAAQDLKPLPALMAHVIDTTGTLDAGQLQALAALLSNLKWACGPATAV